MLTMDEPLSTERLLLRAFVESDLEAVHALGSDPEVVRYIPWPVRTREQSQQWLADRIVGNRLEKDDDGVVWAVVRRSDERLLGGVNLWWRSIADQQAEVGYVFAREAQGVGYATEAVRAVVDTAFRVLDVHRVYARLDARNEASARLLTRLGMRHEAHLREDGIFKGEWGDTDLYAVLAQEWRSR
jgi:RimJ/RimL family protein N-acetyltransferase